MKIVSFEQFGPPEQVCRCSEREDPAAPGPDEVQVRIEAFPINPVDLLTISGRYAVRPDLPAVPGSEAVARITQCGARVDHLAAGDRVLLLGRENWMQAKCVPAEQVVKLPDADPLQLAMLKVNPATALLMLQEIVDLAPGEWVIQDAANSAVGQCVIALARGLQIKTVNIVRRAVLVDPLRQRGADVVLVDGDDLTQRIAEATEGAEIKLAIDAVAGDLCDRLAASLAPGGTIVNYGLLSGRPCAVSPYHLIFRDIRVRGFWLVRQLSGMPPAAVQALYSGLAERVAQGAINVAVEATYPIDEIQKALRHAAQEGRRGKVLVTPNSGCSGAP